DRRRPADVAALRHCHQLWIADALRRPTQRDGPPVVQASLDEVRSRAGRAQHLHAVLEPHLDPALLEVGADRRCDLECRAAGRTLPHPGLLRIGLGDPALSDVPDRPLRSVRTAPGVAALAGPPLYTASVQYAVALQVRASSTLRRLVDDLL